MFVIVVTCDKSSNGYWENLLRRFGQKFEIRTTENLQDYLLTHNYNGHYLAVILDRVFVNTELFYSKSQQVDFFVVLNTWNEKENFKHLPNYSEYKYYEFPIIPELVIDDIKSITKVKDYKIIDRVDLGALSINKNSHTINFKKKSVYLRKKEFELLCFLAQNKGKVVTRSTILDEVWDMNAQIVTNTVDVHVSKIRKILKHEFGVSSLIKTIPCCGYLLTEVYGE